MKVKLMEMTLKEVREEGPFEVAVLPWGACEPHNLHLPFGCDSFAVQKVAENSCKEAKEKGAKVVLLPCMPVGVNSNSFGFPMVLNFMPATLCAMLTDIVDSLQIHGIKKLFILNGHGGNDFKWIIRELFIKKEVRIFSSNWWVVVEDIIEKVCHDKRGDHANEAETSWAMKLFPELVHLQWADDGASKEPRLKFLRENKAAFSRPWHLLTKNSGFGNPQFATTQKGEEIVKNATERIAEMLRELSEAAVDEKFPY